VPSSYDHFFIFISLFIFVSCFFPEPDSVYESKVRPHLQLDASRMFWDDNANIFGSGEEDRSLATQSNGWLYSGSSGMYARGLVFMLERLGIKDELQRLLADGNVDALRAWYAFSLENASCPHFIFFMFSPFFSGVIVCFCCIEF
jgi:hypothetical protein